MFLIWSVSGSKMENLGAAGAVKVALYHPDIPQNTGTILRTAACLDVGVDIIEPCGFVFSDKRLKRSGLDYLARAQITRHVDWDAFYATRREAEGHRLVLLTTQGAVAYTDFVFRPGDVLVLGSESAGVPAAVHDVADARITIPLVAGARSLNVAVACAMVLGEALRQLRYAPQT